MNPDPLDVTTDEEPWAIAEPDPERHLMRLVGLLVAACALAMLAAAWRVR